MQHSETWLILSKHFSGCETQQETEVFLKWMNEDEKNRELFNNAKKIWEGVEVHQIMSRPLTLKERFSKKKVKEFIVKQAIGNFIGFVVGMWVTVMFTHHVFERRSLKNLFGLAGRKKVVVNDAPEWLQGLLAIIIGFIALELVNYFFQNKKHLKVRGYLKSAYRNLKARNQKKASTSELEQL